MRNTFQKQPSFWKSIFSRLLLGSTFHHTPELFSNPLEPKWVAHAPKLSDRPSF